MAFFLIGFIHFIVRVMFCRYVCLYTACVLGALRDQERASSSLELELCMYGGL